MKSALHLPKDFCCAHVYLVPLLAGGATSTHAASVAQRNWLTSIAHAARRGATCSQHRHTTADGVWNPTYTSRVLGRGGAATAGGVTETDHEIGAALSKVPLLRAREVAWQRNILAGCMHMIHVVGSLTPIVAPSQVKGSRNTCEQAAQAMEYALVSTVAAAQRPQLLLQKPFMKSAVHLPNAFCSAHVYLPSGGLSVQVPAFKPTGSSGTAAQPHDVQLHVRIPVQCADLQHCTARS
jgi:hypothetical protein